MDRIVDRTALTGVAFAVMAVGGNLLQGSVPQPHDSPEKSRDFYLGEPSMISAGMVIVLLGVAVLLIFLSVLRDRITSAGGVRLGTLAMAGGTVGAALLAAGAALNAVGGLRAREQGSISEDVAVVLFDGSFILMGLAAATGFLVSMFATGWAALRTGFLPRWVAWFSFLFALPGLVAPVAWLLLLLFPLWAAVVGCLLATRPGPAGAVPAGAA